MVEPTVPAEEWIASHRPGRHPPRGRRVPDRAGPPVRRRVVELAEPLDDGRRRLDRVRPTGRLRARPGRAGRGDRGDPGATPPEGRRARRRRRSGWPATTASTGTSSRPCASGSRRCRPAATAPDGRVLTQLLEFAVHDLGARGIGAILVHRPDDDPFPTVELRLPVPPPLQIGRPADLAPLTHALSQLDGAAVFDGDRHAAPARRPAGAEPAGGVRGRRTRRDAPHRRSPLQLRRPRRDGDRRERGRAGDRAAQGRAGRPDRHRRCSDGRRRPRRSRDPSEFTDPKQSETER